MALAIPFTKWTTYPNHSGVDFPYASGTPIRASANGRVTFSGWLNNRAGNAKIVQYDGGPLVLYCHLVNLNGLAVGNAVGPGDIFAFVGTTGNSTGPHLHIEISGRPGEASVWVHFSKSAVVGSASFAANLTLTGDWVRAIQAKLNRLGYGLAVDGIIGAATTAAVRDFQTKHGLAVDGIPGPQTNARLDSALSAQGTGSNQTTRPTADIQRLVGADADGIYGPGTTAKVKEWQSAHGLVPDGIWGPASDAKGFPAAPDAGAIGSNITARPTADIQRLVGAFPDGDYGPATTAKVKEWQSAHGLVPDGIWGPISDAKGFPA